MKHKAGFVSILGKPNVGKSTLMNLLVGEKLSTITNKAQTTRHRIKGIVSGEDYQIVFSDTPGILNPHYKLHESMMNEVDEAMTDADVVIYMIEPTEEKKTERFQKIIDKKGQQLILLINKVDTESQELIQEAIDTWKALIPEADVIPVSALHQFNTQIVLEKIIEKLPGHPAYYPKDELTDRNLRFFVSEIIREKILLRYQKEVPYSVEVVVESFKESEKLIKIMSYIFVARESQKMIIIGKGGKAIKQMGIDARKDLEKFLGKQVFLELSVKVNKDWRDDESALSRFGYPL